MIRQYLNADKKMNIAKGRLTRYADQLGHWDLAMRYIHPNRVYWHTKDQIGPNHPSNHTATAAPTDPTADFQNAETKPCFSSAMSDTSGSEHSNSIAITRNPSEKE